MPRLASERMRLELHHKEVFAGEKTIEMLLRLAFAHRLNRHHFVTVTDNVESGHVEVKHLLLLCLGQSLLTTLIDIKLNIESQAI